MTRPSYHLVAVLVFVLSTLGVPEAALAQDAGTEEPQGLERVLRATEGLPAPERDEIVGVYHRAKIIPFGGFYDPACIALAYWEWRRENPEEPGGSHRFQIGDDQGRISACADRDLIVSSMIERAEHLLVQPGVTQDEIRPLATCTAELVADRFLEDPPNRPQRRYQADLFSRALSECRRALQVR
jgi:hypothetical protein